MGILTIISQTFFIFFLSLWVVALISTIILAIVDKKANFTPIEPSKKTFLFVERSTGRVWEIDEIDYYSGNYVLTLQTGRDSGLVGVTQTVDMENLNSDYEYVGEL